MTKNKYSFFEMKKQVKNFPFNFVHSSRHAETWFYSCETYNKSFTILSYFPIFDRRNISLLVVVVYSSYVVVDELLLMGCC